jgi:hypothetical protein
MKTSRYKFVSLVLALIFAAVGLLFLVWPDATIRSMNGWGRAFGLAEAPLGGAGFYTGLAVGYMYVVTLLAWSMFRRPSRRVFPLLLAHAKAASGLVSLGLFLFHRPSFVCLANGLVDLLLAGLALALYFDRKRAAAEAP